MSTKKTEQAEEHNFLQRWSRRKQAQVSEKETAIPPTAFPATDIVDSDNTAISTTTAEDENKEEKIVELPDVASLNAESDYTGFLDKDVDQQLRKIALRTLFKQTQFNAVDDLDVYYEDFADFEPLGDIVTHDMRHMMEVEKRREEEKARQAAETETETETEECDVEPEVEQTLPSADTKEIKEAKEGEELAHTEHDEAVPTSKLSVEKQEENIKK